MTGKPDDDARLLAGMLAEDLTRLASGAWLVFDDCHTIAGTLPAERFVEALLLEAPVNMLLMTRRRPSLGVIATDPLWRSFEMDGLLWP